MHKLDERDIYERLWKGRDFEIKHLWQRSVFLATFLVLIFTAYAGLWAAFIGDSRSEEYFMSPGLETIDGEFRAGIMISRPEEEPSFLEPFEKKPYIAAGFSVLCLLGGTFSILWICMAKGSKYWYEKYERSIDFMHDEESLFSDAVNDAWRKEEAVSKLEWRRPHMAPIQGYLQDSESNVSIFSREGGPYSMSRVNIMIGQVFTVFWFLAFGFHSSTLFIHIAGGSHPVRAFVVGFSAAIGAFWGMAHLFRMLLTGGEYDRHSKKEKKRARGSGEKERSERDRKYEFLKETFLIGACRHPSLGGNDEEYCGKYTYLEERMRHGHLDHDDTARLKLFLEEYVAPGHFMSESSHKYWKLPESSFRFSFPMTKTVYMGILEEMCIPAGDIEDIRFFADLENIGGYDVPDDAEMAPRIYHLYSIAVDGHGEFVNGIGFTEKIRRGYEESLSYVIIDSDGKEAMKGACTPV